MALTLSAGDWIDQLEYPEPSDFPDAESWLDGLFAAESARGPQHGAEPNLDYGFLWALWLSAVPYGLWSEQISRPSMEEHVQWIERLEQACAQALEHFGRTVRDGTSVNDLACAIASMIEGTWLNQCLTPHHPCDPTEPIATALCRSGRLLWRGATEPSG